MEALERELTAYELQLEDLSAPQAVPAELPSAPLAEQDEGRVSHDAPSPPASGVSAPEPPLAQTQRGQRGACEVGCDALAGMRRSAVKICELTGAQSDACERAGERVARAARRVSGAGCVCDAAAP